MKQNPTYIEYVILEQAVPDEVSRRLVRSHFGGGGNAEQPQPTADYVAHRFGECKTCVACWSIVNENTMINVETIELFGKVHNVTGDVARLAQLCGKTDGIAKGDDGLDDVIAFIGGDCGKVHIVKVYVAAFAERACATSIGVLNVRCGFSVKVEHLVIGENDVFYAVVPKRREHHRSDADALGNLVFVLGVGIFFLR